MLFYNSCRSIPEIWGWQGRSGYWYAHNIFPMISAPKWIAECNYLFVAVGGDHKRYPIYIGQTGNLRSRLTSHEKLRPALDLGATEIHVHLLGVSEDNRLLIEADLLDAYYTPLNQRDLPAGVVNTCPGTGLVNACTAHAVTGLGGLANGCTAHAGDGLGGGVNTCAKHASFRRNWDHVTVH